MGFNDIIAGLSDTFIDQFGETITFYPLGVNADRVVISANVDMAALIGTREAEGDGVVMDDDDGFRDRDTVMIDIKPGAVTVQEPQDPIRPDLVKLSDGTMLAVQTISGKDSAMWTLHCTQQRASLVRKGKRR